ncbi:MAG: WXG100 family type VII secretion target [Phycisphaerales bacterium]
MAKAIVDPDELRQFALELKRFNTELQSRLASMQGRLSALGQSWRDQEHDRFVEEFQDTMKTLVRFTEASERHIPFLLRKAERIDEYLKQR